MRRFVRRTVPKLDRRSSHACPFSKFIRRLGGADLRRRRRGSGCFAPDIPMMKSAHAREANDAGAIGGPRVSRSPGWRIAERGVDALGVVVLDVLPKQAPQMVFAEHHHVIEKLPPNASDEAFSRAVLPRASERRAPGTDAECLDRGGDLSGEDGVVVELRVIGEGVAQLLDDPGRRGILGDMEAKDSPSS